jgi:hypothetical protein
MNRYQVVVGNIGTVYDGNNFMSAWAAFSAYKKQSAKGVGRAAGESVTLFDKDEIRHEYSGSQETL